MTGEKYVAANSPPLTKVGRAYWQQPREGMNIYGVCKNVECLVFGSCVTFQVENGGLGFDTFNMKKKIPSHSLCPQCKKACNGRATSCSFYRCRWKYKGVALEWDGSHYVAVKKRGGHYGTSPM